MGCSRGRVCFGIFKAPDVSIEVARWVFAWTVFMAGWGPFTQAEALLVLFKMLNAICAGPRVGPLTLSVL